MNVSRGVVVWVLMLIGAGCGDDETSRDVVDSASTDTSVQDTTVTETTVTEATVTEATVTETTVTEATATETAVTETLDDVATEVADDTNVADTLAETSDASGGRVLGESARLTSAGWSFGECSQHCSATVTFAGASLSFRLQDNQGGVEHEANGMLTTGGAAELQNLEGDVVDDPLLEVYGCPDCADGGARFLLFSTDTTPFNTTYEYGDPPEVLAPLTTFVADVIDALRSCTTNERVLIQGQCPLPER
ncbi:MAG: hypothetical protein IT385_00975 [Deltaproteobacteria bacterium]|nr:hypothetical protein [Deltaproteobacteria bacterium]